MLPVWINYPEYLSIVNNGLWIWLIDLLFDCARHGNLLVGHSEVNIQHQRLLTRTGLKLDEELLFILAL